MSLSSFSFNTLIQGEEGIPNAVDYLVSGELVAFPTETVYGLGALGTYPSAIHKIYEVKGRPQDNPLILHFASPEDMLPYIGYPNEYFKALSKALMPGPLTLIMPASDRVPSAVTAGLKTVGVRCPSEPLAHKLLASIPFRVPIAAPSANLSGSPSPTTALDVKEDLDGKIPLILDGGPCQVGLESTILDLTNPEGLRILRPGFIHEELIASVLDAEHLSYHFLHGKVEVHSGPAKAPGMKYRHYAPKASIRIIEGKNVEEKISNYQAWLKEKKAEQTKPLGVYGSLTFLHALKEQGLLNEMDKVLTPPEGEREALQLAAGLFHAFREMDRAGMTEIAVEALADDPIAPAYMNRLRKASLG